MSTTSTIKWTRQAAGWYTATTPAGHEIEISEQEYGWVLRSADPEVQSHEAGNDPTETLWMAKEDAEYWDEIEEQNAAWEAKQNARWGGTK